MSDNKESSVVALHNLMHQYHSAPIYECLQKFGKSHKPYFRFRCKAMGDVVIGTGRSKKDAKHVVARLMLEQLSLRGYMVPLEYRSPEAMSQIMERAGIPTRSFVVLLQELCRQYHLDQVEYDVMMSETSGLLNFTVKASLGHVQRIATASSKRMATQLAAEQIYKHLRTRLSGTRTFNEEVAMRRAYERAMMNMAPPPGLMNIAPAPTMITMTPAPTMMTMAQAPAPAPAPAAGEEAAAAERRNEGGDEAAGTEEKETQSNEEPMDDGSVASTSRQFQEDAQNAAISALSFIEATMERLGI